MILVDTSVWIELLRGTRSPAHLALRDLIETTPAEIATCEPIVMELLAGPTDPFTIRRIEDQLGTLHYLAFDPSVDFRSAAALARQVRRSGHTIRSMTDCLIATVAVKHDTAIWHCDADFERVAEVSELRQRDVRL